MRNIPATLLARAQSDSFHWADLVKITLQDGTVHRFTGHDREITVTFDGDAAAAFSPRELAGLKAYSAKIALSIDDSELSLVIDGETVVADDIRRGFWNGAAVGIGFCDWSAPELGGYLHRAYEIGKATIDDGIVTFELRGPEHRLERDVSVPLTVNCRHQLGDSRCLVELDAEEWQPGTEYTGAETEVLRDSARAVVKPSVYNGFWFRALTSGTSAGGTGGTGGTGGSTGEDEPDWPTALGETVVDGDVTWEAIHARRRTGTVDSVVSNRQFVSADTATVDTGSATTGGDDFFGEGWILWLTGDNAGMKSRIRADDGLGTITLYEATFDPISALDTFVIVAGCRKRPVEDCLQKYRNRWNFGGFTHLADENVFGKAAKG